MIDDEAEKEQRRVQTLTIRELVLELSTVEELVVRQNGTELSSYAVRSLAEREELIARELRARAARLPAIKNDDEAADAGGRAVSWAS